MNPMYDTLKRLREKAGLTQKEVAEQLGIAPTNYSLLERGKVELTASRMYRIAEILNIKVSDLLLGDEATERHEVLTSAIDHSSDAYKLTFQQFQEMHAQQQLNKKKMLSAILDYCIKYDARLASFLHEQYGQKLKPEERIEIKNPEEVESLHMKLEECLSWLVDEFLIQEKELTELIADYLKPDMFNKVHVVCLAEGKLILLKNFMLLLLKDVATELKK